MFLSNYRAPYRLAILFPIFQSLKISRCNSVRAQTLVFSTLSPVSLFRLRKCSSWGRWSGSCCQRVDAGALSGCLVQLWITNTGSQSTQTTVSSHHSQTPRGLQCACEKGAYFVFLSPDSHPWGSSSSRDVLHAIFSLSVCEHWNYQEALDWKTWEVKRPPRFPPSLLKSANWPANIAFWINSLKSGDSRGGGGKNYIIPCHTLRF